MYKVSIKNVRKGDYFKLKNRSNSPIYQLIRLDVDYGLVRFCSYQIAGTNRVFYKHSDFDVYI